LGRHDVWVIGHVTRDRIRTPAAVDERAGGTATYFALALARLGGDVGVLTRLAAEDQDELLAEHRAESLEIVCAPSAETTEFENRYPASDPDRCVQRVGAVAHPFEPLDLGAVSARTVHLGPLTNGDMSCEFLRSAAECGRVSLDVQGLVRCIERGRVELRDWAQKREGLAHVDVLKANELEARVLTSESDPARAARLLASWGPDEVLVTLGSLGSLVFCGGRVDHIRSLEGPAPVDPTGCGDTYMAAYLGERSSGRDARESARFASAAAALKLRAAGPLRATREHVLKLLHT
jgi:sugar/nucleoside kinase (ribokinase family)